MLKKIVLGLWLLVGVLTSAFAVEIVANKHYKELTQEQLDTPILHKLQQSKNKQDEIIILEVFNYGCFYCYKLTNNIYEYLANHCDVKVKFIKVPLVFNKPGWDALAKAYYVAQTMNNVPKLDKLLNDQLHVKKNKITNEQELFSLVAGPVDIKKFTQEFYSPGVTQKLVESTDLARKLKILLIPSLIVKIKDKYYLIAPNLPNEVKVMDVLNYLLAVHGK